MLNRKKLKGQKNKEVKIAKSELLKYEEEISKYKDLEDYHRLPQFVYNKNLNCFVLKTE